MTRNRSKDYSFILDGMRWSFSSVNCYSNCPKCFELSYLEPVPKVNNAFAEWGSFCHSILERYYKGEVELFELSDIYEREYENHVKAKFPANAYADLNQSYYAAGKKYFDFFEGDYPIYDVLGVEQKIELQINGKNFIGYIDLVVKSADGIIICDHKSKSKFTSKREKDEYLRQLYLYSIWVKQKYGEYPKWLVFNMFRSEGLVWTEFDETKLAEAIAWFDETVNQIYQDDTFKDKISTAYKGKKKPLKDFKKDDYFCNNLCSVRRYCNRSKSYKG